MPGSPDPESVARFVDACVALGLTPTTPLGLAVSGGGDSLALLLLAHAAGFHVRAATVDHGLRTAAPGEAAFVGELCRRLGVPHDTLGVAPFPGGNVSAWARAVRYEALAAWRKANRLEVILTAHHADDQLETMVMRLNRGSGVAGLAAIRARAPGIARPLLQWRRAELAAIVAAAGLDPVDDPSNRDDRFDRARLRKALQGADWLDPVAAARSAHALGQAEDALQWVARQFEERLVSEAGEGLRFEPLALPHELVRRILLACLTRLGAAQDPRGDALDRAISALRRGATVTLAGVRCAGGATWTLTPARPRRQTRSRPGDIARDQPGTTRADPPCDQP